MDCIRDPNLGKLHLHRRINCGCPPTQSRAGGHLSSSPTI